MTAEEICNRLKELKTLIVEANAEYDKKNQASRVVWNRVRVLEHEYSQKWNELDKCLGDDPTFSTTDLQCKAYELRENKPS